MTTTDHTAPPMTPLGQPATVVYDVGSLEIHRPGCRDLARLRATQTSLTLPADADPVAYLNDRLYGGEVEPARLAALLRRMPCIGGRR